MSTEGSPGPYFHPRYAGQMMKPPHPVARLAYAPAMLINPNNHALDGGRASSADSPYTYFTGAELDRSWATLVSLLEGPGQAG